MSPDRTKTETFLNFFTMIIKIETYWELDVDLKDVNLTSVRRQLEDYIETSFLETLSRKSIVYGNGKNVFATYRNADDAYEALTNKLRKK